MNKLINNTKVALLAVIVLFSINCSNDKEDSITEEQSVSSSELKVILDTDSHTSSVDQIITDLFENGESGKSAKIDECYQTEFSNTGYMVTFANCSVEGSDPINGSISVSYKIGDEDNAFTAAYTNLTFGEIEINGTKEFLMADNGLSFSIVSDMEIKQADGSIIEELGTKNFEFNIDTENLANSGFGMEGDWTVKADDDVYIVNITSPLTIPSTNCQYVTSGIMSLNKNGLGVTVDFGDGSCDAIATITYPNGTEEEVSLKED